MFISECLLSVSIEELITWFQMSNDLLFTIGEANVYEDDLETLKDGNWLTDGTVSFLLELAKADNHSDNVSFFIMCYLLLYCV